jgi:hypothetical protein
MFANKFGNKLYVGSKGHHGESHCQDLQTYDEGNVLCVNMGLLTACKQYCSACFTLTYGRK